MGGVYVMHVMVEYLQAFQTTIITLVCTMVRAEAAGACTHCWRCCGG